MGAFVFFVVRPLYVSIPYFILTQRMKQSRIDIWLRLLIATSEGDLIGRNFFEFLKVYDTKITKRMAELQRKGLKPQDKKYRYLKKMSERG